MNEERIEMGSGNVFKDLEFPNPDLEHLKSALSFEIYNILTTQKLDKKTVARRLEIDASDVAMLKAGDGDFSMEQLFSFLNRLNYNVDIYISLAKDGKTHQQLHAAD